MKQLPDEKKLIMKFRRGCLRNKFPIYEEDGLQIGILCEQTNKEPKTFLKFSIYFKNKSDTPMTDFQF